ncbi:MAG TPA: glycosyltransferase family 39 protein [Thermomicrobiales bacterium]|nr:glycosyltransferase family 39 protein [Thermomicrobiales bacterium]
MSSIERFMLVLMLAYVAKQVFSVFVYPAFSGHDEVAHYSHIRTLATEGRLPTLPNLEQWRAVAATGQTPPTDQLPAELYPYCRFVLDWFCEPANERWARTPPRIVTVLGQLYPSGYDYTANHPPLYYAVMTPVYWLTRAFSPTIQQYIFRLFAIPFGAATVWLAYRLAATIFPGDAFLAVTTAALVAFQPQISYEAAMVNNDIASIALYAWMTLLLARGIRDRFPRRLCVWLGVAFGLALLTKGTSLSVGPAIALAIIWSTGWRDVRTWLTKGILAAAPAAVLAAPWYLYMYRTYGNFDALPQVAALQWWNSPAGSFFGMLTSRDFIWMRFKETWGEFGWRLISLSPALLAAIAIPTAVCLAGLVVYVVIVGRRLAPPDDRVARPATWQWQALGTMAAICLFGYLAVIQFGVTFSLTQARYFFPVVNAGAFLSMLGLRTIVPARWRPAAQGVVVAALVVLTILIFAQYVAPFGVSSHGEPGFG